MRKNKKGSMELGVNSIVILIIALAVLGLGIGFVTNLFGQGREKLGGIINSVDLPVHADAVDPMKFQYNQLEIKAGKSKNLIVSVYNDGTLDSSGLADVELDFSAGGCEPADIAYLSNPSIVSPAQSIPVGKDAGYSALITVPRGATDAESWVCTITTVTTPPGVTEVSKQIFITVVQ